MSSDAGVARRAGVLLVGGGLAATRTAQALRADGYDGSVILASEEHELPYDRPPLSKEMISAGAGPSRLLSDEDARAAGLEVRLGHRAVGLDLTARRVRFDGDLPDIGYERLVVATGARPRTLPVLAGAACARTLRTVEDSRWLRARFVPGAKVVVVGAGFVGLEVAATARGAGCEVDVVEAAASPLERAVGPELGGWLIERHRDQGVRVRCGVCVASWAPCGDGVQLELSDGAQLAADVVVVGVGITRDLSWLAGAGLDVHAGLTVDACGRTSDPAVFGVGDITCVHDADGVCTVTQHWTATTTQTGRVAATMLARPAPPTARDEGYVWSDQYDMKIQLVGAMAGAARLMDDSAEASRFLAEYYRGDRLVGAAAVNCPRDLLKRRLALRSGG